MKLCNFSSYCCQDIKDLENESDMTQAKACTSSLQLWHRPVRGEDLICQKVNVKILFYQMHMGRLGTQI